MKKRNVTLHKVAINLFGLYLMGSFGAAIGGGPNPGSCTKLVYADKPILEGFVTLIASQIDEDGTTQWHVVAIFDGLCDKKNAVNIVVPTPLTTPELPYGFVDIEGTSIDVDFLMGECAIPTNKDGVEAQSIVVTEVTDFLPDPTFDASDPYCHYDASNDYPNPNGLHCGSEGHDGEPEYVVSSPVSAEVIAKFAWCM